MIHFKYNFDEVNCWKYNIIKDKLCWEKSLKYIEKKVIEYFKVGDFLNNYIESFNIQ